MSKFATQITAMLEYRVACGYKRDTHSRNLQKFDSYCTEYFPDSIVLTYDIVHGWLDSATVISDSINAKATSIR